MVSNRKVGLKLRDRVMLVCQIGMQALAMGKKYIQSCCLQSISLGTIELRLRLGHGLAWPVMPSIFNSFFFFYKGHRLET